jgi:hypothetical protein
MAIEKISEEEFQSSFFKGRGRKSAIFIALSELKVGEIIKFDSAALRRKNQLAKTLYYIRKNYHYEFSGGRLANGSGWAYKREK